MRHCNDVVFATSCDVSIATIQQHQSDVGQGRCNDVVTFCLMDNYFLGNYFLKMSSLLSLQVPICSFLGYLCFKFNRCVCPCLLHIICITSTSSIQKYSFVNTLQNRFLKNLVSFTGKHLGGVYFQESFFTEHLRRLLLSMLLFTFLLLLLPCCTSTTTLQHFTFFV